MCLADICRHRHVVAQCFYCDVTDASLGINNRVSAATAGITLSRDIQTSTNDNQSGCEQEWERFISAARVRCSGQASCERGMWIDELVTSSPLAEPAAAESAIDVTLTPCHALQAAWTVRL